MVSSCPNVAQKVLDCLTKAEQARINRTARLKTDEIDYDSKERQVTLPNNLWTDGYSSRCGFIAKLCWLTGTRIIGIDAGQQHKDLNTADDCE